MESTKEQQANEAERADMIEDIDYSLQRMTTEELKRVRAYISRIW